MVKSLISLNEAVGHHGSIVKYYRRIVINQPRGWTQEQLAEAMGVSVRWVQEIERMKYIQDIHRRKALALILGIPAALLDIEKLGLFPEDHIPLLDTITLNNLEGEIQSRWRTYYSSSNQIAEEGLLEQIEILEQLADYGKGETKDLARLLSQSYQLAGTLARDNFKYSRAKRYFRDALNFAKEAQSPDLISASLARYALVFLRQERIEDALSLYTEAVDLAKNAQPLVQSYTNAGLAEVLARKGLQDGCYRTLDFAQGLLDKADNMPQGDDLAFVRLTIQSLQDKRGECSVLSGKPRKGIEYLQMAEKLIDHNFSRNYCSLLLQQSEAYLAAGEPDTCVAYATDGLQLARKLGSAGNVTWVSEIHTKLLVSPWKNEPVVGKLGTAIAME